MHARRNELKLATRNDCIETYGPEKLSQCQCLANKMDYNAVFAFMTKFRANPKGDYRREIRRLDAMTDRAIATAALCKNERRNHCQTGTICAVSNAETLSLNT